MIGNNQAQTRFVTKLRFMVGLAQKIAEMNGVIQKYIQSPDMPADDPVKFMKLTWDCVGSKFASRHTSYEKFYAGAPFIFKSHLYREYDFAKSQALAETALAGYYKTGRIELPTSGRAVG